MAVENSSATAEVETKKGKKGKTTFRNPWSWVPSLYFAEGVPYAMVMMVSIVMYKNMGISNADITFYTSWLSLPWVIKPLWSPFVDMFKKKRSWIIVMQFLIGAGLSGVALTIPASSFFQYTLMFLFLVAFSSATHDIAADGFYMLALNEHDQAFYAGIRGTFYRIAMIVAQSGLVSIAGVLVKKWTAPGVTPALGTFVHAWTVVFYFITGLFLAFAVYHYFILPHPAADKPTISEGSHGILKNFLRTFALFFQKKKIWLVVIFLLLYRFGEAQLLSLVTPFLLDARSVGGLGLSNELLGIVSGIGIAGLLLGGITGGILAARVGLGRALWWMFAAINTPALVYIFLSFVQPDSMILISACVGFEQFCYGFGFTAYMLYMMYVCGSGELKTSHYSIATGFMALSMMIPRMFSGFIQQQLGYKNFFLWVFFAVIPAFFITRAIPMDPEFGKKTEEKK